MANVPSTSRRHVLRTAGATLSAVAVAGCTDAPWSTDQPPSVTAAPVPTTATPTPTGAVVVELVDFSFEPGTNVPLVVAPGTTIRFVWVTASHTIRVDSKPAASTWQGHEPIEEAGFTHEHTFTAAGRYRFHCGPHQSLGMVGTLLVE